MTSLYKNKLLSGGISHAVHFKFFRILIIILGLLAVMLIVVGTLWYIGAKNNQRVLVAIARGDEDLAPYIEQISKTAWFVTSTFSHDIQSDVYRELRDNDQEIAPEILLVIRPHLEEVFKTFPYIQETHFTYFTSGLSYDHYLESNGVLHEDVYDYATHEFRTRVLISSLLQKTEMSMERIEKHRDGALTIPYTSALRTVDGTLVGAATIHVALEEFFRGFEGTSLKNLFVTDSEGHYLWHSNPQKHNELRDGRDSSFFDDYPEGYPDILAGRGQHRIRDGEKYIQVRPIYVAFEVIVNGEIKKINTQNISPQHYTWFIGYEEK